MDKFEKKTACLIIKMNKFDETRMGLLKKKQGTLVNFATENVGRAYRVDRQPPVCEKRWEKTRAP